MYVTVFKPPAPRRLFSPPLHRRPPPPPPPCPNPRPPLRRPRASAAASAAGASLAAERVPLTLQAIPIPRRPSQVVIADASLSFRPGPPCTILLEFSIPPDVLHPNRACRPVATVCTY